MYAHQLTIGQFFTSVFEPDGIWQRIPNHLATGWETAAGAVAVNTVTGLFGSFGPLAQITPADRPEHPRRELIEADVVKLVERDYEFGIGGIGMADDPYYAQAQYQPTGETCLKLTGSPKRNNGGGQLWEPCPRCGEEPVHLDCGYCDRHCQC